jgi:hypothetical protein
MRSARTFAVTNLGAVTLFGALALRADPARAAGEETSGNAANPDAHHLVSGFAAQKRPVGMAEASVSVLTLPGAEVCVERSAGCSKGDVVFALEGWELYRASKRWAFGAGAMIGLIPTAHPREPPETIPRDHSRSYLTFEGMLRYYPYVGRDFEGWVGVLGGLAVVSDSFDVIDKTDERALLGGRGVTIRTEGGSVGLAGGFAFGLSEHWSLLGSLRLSQWFLPKEPARDPLGSEASLTGRNSAVTLGFGIAYRASL